MTINFNMQTSTEDNNWLEGVRLHTEFVFYLNSQLKKNR